MEKKIKIANAPCSWGALEFEVAGKSLGYEQVLNELVETGYAGTELGDWGFMPTDPKALHDDIAKRNALEDVTGLKEQIRGVDRMSDDGIGPSLHQPSVRGDESERSSKSEK